MLNSRAGQIKAEATRFYEAFIRAGAMPVEAASLQPADTLLDLYGEDIRARAFVTHDPDLGEQMLRPDFTVPVVQMHMHEGSEPARYAYNGPVWRKQEAGQRRASETIQVGFELFDRTNPAEADAEVFALFSSLLKNQHLRVATGDMGLIRAAVEGLKTTDRRKAALLRHLWRPQRFRQLLDRFGGKTKPDATRTALVEKLKKTNAQTLLDQAKPSISLRRPSEILDRVNAIQEDANTPPISKTEVTLLNELLSLRAPSLTALNRLRDMEVDMPALGPTLNRLEDRLTAIFHRGINVETLPFEASFGRTTLEYYDGFVFGFFAEARPDLPVIASGGRYDALTRVLGDGNDIPAVGGVIRPEALLDLGGQFA